MGTGGGGWGEAPTDQGGAILLFGGLLPGDCMTGGVGAFLRIDWLRGGMALWLPEVQASCTIGPRFTTHYVFGIFVSRSRN